MSCIDLLPGSLLRPRSLLEAEVPMQLCFSRAEENLESLRNMELIDKYMKSQNILSMHDDSNGSAGNTVSRFLTKKFRQFVPFCTIFDHVLNNGGDCGYLCAVDPFVSPIANTSTPEVALHLQQRRLNLATHLRNTVANCLLEYDEERQIFPILEGIYVYDEVKKASQILFASIALHEDISDDHNCWKPSDANALEADYWNRLPIDSMDRLRRFALRVREQQWMEQSTWLIVAAIIERPVVIINMVYVLRDKEYKLSVVTIPSLNDDTVRADFRERVCLYIPFTGSAGSTRPTKPYHYQTLLIDQRYVESDYSSSDETYSPSETSSSADDICSSIEDGTASDSEESNSKAEKNRKVDSNDGNARKERRLPVHFNIDNMPKFQTDADVDDYVFRSSLSIRVRLYKDKKSNTIIYRCCHTACYSKRIRRQRKQIVGRDGKRKRSESVVFNELAVEDGTDDCNGRLHFALKDSEWVIDPSKCVLQHSCPATIPARTATEKILLGRWDGKVIPESNVALKRMWSDLDIKNNLASKVRKTMRQILYGTEEANFAQLPNLLARYKSGDPDSTYHVGKDECSRLIKFFFAPGYIRDAWQYGLLFFSVDATHSKFEGGGMWYFGLTVTATNEYLPLSLSYCASEETSAGWQYHLEKAKEAGITDTEDTVVMTDRRPGIGEVLNQVFPLSDKVACSRHIGQNAKVAAKYYGRNADTIVNRLAKAFTWESYLRIERQTFEAADDQAQMKRFLEYLRDPSQWNEDWSLCSYLKPQQNSSEIEDNNNVSSSSSAMRFGIVTTNASEVMNSVLREARALPICAATHHIIRWMYDRFGTIQNRFIERIKNRYGKDILRRFDSPIFQREITPGSFSDQIEEFRELNKKFPLRMYDVSSALDINEERIWRVERMDGKAMEDGVQKSHGVKWKREGENSILWSCTCNVPTHVGIPCRHVLFVMEKAINADSAPRGPRRALFSYHEAIHSRLTIGRAWKALTKNVANARAISTYNLSSLQPFLECSGDVLRPHMHIKRAKRSKKRIRSSGEGRGHKCTKCGEYGHNQRTCVQNVSQQ